MTGYMMTTLYSPYSASGRGMWAASQTASRSLNGVHYGVCTVTAVRSHFRQQADIWDSAILFVNISVLCSNWMVKESEHGQAEGFFFVVFFKAGLCVYVQNKGGWHLISSGTNYKVNWSKTVRYLNFVCLFIFTFK